SLNIPSLDTSVTIRGTSLESNAIPSGPHSSISYQWLDCDNDNTPIQGATDRRFIPNRNGNYAVRISKDSCTAISACQNFVAVGLENEFLNSLTYYPNPTSARVYIEFEEIYPRLEVEIYSPQGKFMKAETFDSVNVVSLDLPQEASLYFVKIRAGQKMAIIKLFKK
ncbi:MAG: T9SS type A sorting domain-containing protein, partial [Bacteroidota bacterium]